MTITFTRQNKCLNKIEGSKINNSVLKVRKLSKTKGFDE